MHLDRAAGGTSVALVRTVVAVVLGSVAAHESHAHNHNVGSAGGTNVMVMNLLTRLRMLRRNDSGQDLLEYALLVALIALVAIGAITTTGTGVSTVFQDISDQLGTP